MSYILVKDDQVRNIEGTSQCDPRRSTTSWKQYWTEKTGQKWPEQCQIKNCTRLASDGGHVNIRKRPTDRGVYIIPLCSSCNNPNNTSWMTANARTAAAKVEKEDTSGDEGTCH